MNPIEQTPQNNHNGRPKRHRLDGPSPGDTPAVVWPAWNTSHRKNRKQTSRKRLCRRCGKPFASPEWRPFHEKPNGHSWKDIWEFCTVGESEFEKGFPSLPKRPKEGDGTKPTTISKPLPLAKPPHPLKSLPASKPNEKKRVDTSNIRADSDAHSSPKQSKGYEFNGISYPTYSEMVAAKRERNRKVLERTLSEISSFVDKKSLSSLKGDDSAASRSNKKRGRPRGSGKKEALSRLPVRRNPRRSASANASYGKRDDVSVGSKSTLSSRSSSSHSAAIESAESEDSEDITSEVGVKKRGAKRKRVASPPVSVRRNPRRSTASSAKRPSLGSVSSVNLKSSLRQDPEQNKTATREYARVVAAQQAAAGSRPRETQRRLCRRCGKPFASPEWRPFHERPYGHLWKDIWEFCTVGESEFEKGFPCFDTSLPKRPKEGDGTKPTTMSKPLPLAKPPHPLKSLPASKPNEKKRVDTSNIRDGICDRCGKNYRTSKWRDYHRERLPNGYLGEVHGSKVFEYCTVPQSECEPGNPMPKVSRTREPTMSSSDSDAHSSPKQSKGYEFNGISYPTYSEMVAAKRERNRKVLERTLSEISSFVDKKSLSSLKGDDSAASRSNKKRGRPRGSGKKEALSRSPVRRNPRRSASANASYTERDDWSVGSKSTLSSRSSSSHSAANESAESEDSEDITPAKLTHPPSEVGVKKRGAKRKRVASPPVSVRRNPRRSTASSAKRPSLGSVSSVNPKSSLRLNDRKVTSVGGGRAKRPSLPAPPGEIYVPMPQLRVNTDDAPSEYLPFDTSDEKERIRGPDADNLLPPADVRDMTATLEHIVLDGFRVRNRENAWRDFWAMSSKEEEDVQRRAPYSLDKKLYGSLADVDGGNYNRNDESGDELIPKQYLLTLQHNSKLNEDQSANISALSTTKMDQLWIDEYGDGLDPRMFVDERFRLPSDRGESGQYTELLLQTCWDRAMHAVSSTITVNLDRQHPDDGIGLKEPEESNEECAVAKQRRENGDSNKERLADASSLQSLHCKAMKVLDSVLDLVLSANSSLLHEVPEKNTSVQDKRITWVDICKVLKTTVQPTEIKNADQTNPSESIDDPVVNEATEKAITMRLIERYGPLLRK